MYAVIKTGGKQYRVKEGDTLRVEKLDGEVGDKVSFTEVLMIGGEQPKIGLPFVDAAKVEASIVEQGRGRKVFSFKKRQRGWSKIRGHRQAYTALKIEKISG
ncbi:MAG TPA: 50S ribosomal protein L21 [Fredinandcohnia sp.]|nr:50S ribosomal protein L21 [Fredinandcohnia sp.]